jgi:hypothetical protein
MNAYSTLQVSSLQTWNVPQLNQSDGCGPTTIRYPNPVPSPHSSTAVASVTIPASDAAPYAISPETSPRDLTLRHNEIPNLDDIPDIAKEALRITKESLGSECQLLHQGMYTSIETPWRACGTYRRLPALGISLSQASLSVFLALTSFLSFHMSNFGTVLTNHSRYHQYQKITNDCHR